MNKVYEGNDGGLMIVSDNGEGVAGLEFAQKGKGLRDLIYFGDTWFAVDVGSGTVGSGTVGYHADGNTSGDKDDDGDEITIEGLDADNNMLVASYDGTDIVLHVSAMGQAAEKYFGLTD